MKNYTIQFTDIQYQYLNDEEYFNHYNLEYEMTQEEIEETIEQLKNQTEYTLDDFQYDGEDLDKEFFWEWLELEIGSYITDFSLKVLAK